MDAWASRAIVDIETVHSVVKAYAEGKIQLSEPAKNSAKAYVRCAPSFKLGEPGRLTTKFPYTAQTIGEFLGWLKPSGTPTRKIDTCLTALQYAEEGILDLSIFEKLGTGQMEAVIDEASRARRAIETSASLAEKQAAESAKQEAEAHEREITAKSDFEAKEANKARMRAAKAREHAELDAIEKRNQAKKEATKVAEHLSSGMRKGDIATNKAMQEAFKVRSKPEEAPPHIEKSLRKVLKQVGAFLNDREGDDLVSELTEILAYKKHLSAHARADAAATLTQLAKRANAFAKQFENAPYVEIE